MKNIVVDIGNFDMKYAGDRVGKFSSMYSTRYEPNAEAYERIEFDGVTTLIGTGELEREFNKAEKNVLPLVLYAISCATNNNDINLALLMPINQLPQKERLINKFQGKTFRCKVNGESKVIRVHKCVVLPESQVSYYSLENPSPYQLIIDIGSRTINWCAYEDGKMKNSGTEKLGVYDFYHSIMNVENAKGEDFTVETIVSQIKRGRVKVTEQQYKEFLHDVLNRIKAQVNLKNYDALFVGGGSLLLKNIIERIPSVKIHENPVYSNVLGAQEVCKARWR